MNIYVRIYEFQVLREIYRERGREPLSSESRKSYINGKKCDPCYKNDGSINLEKDNGDCAFHVYQSVLLFKLE